MSPTGVFRCDGGENPRLGRFLLVAARGGSVRLWSEDTLACLGELGPARDLLVGDVAVEVPGRNGSRFAAVAEADGRVVLWRLDLDVPQEQVLTVHPEMAVSVAFGVAAGGEPLLASGGSLGSLLVHELPSNRVRSVPTDQFSQVPESIRELAFARTVAGRTLLLFGGTDLGGINICDPLTGELLPYLPESGCDHVMKLSVTSAPHGQVVVSAVLGFDNGTSYFAMWDLESGLGIPPRLRVDGTSLWMTAARAVWTPEWGLLVISADDEGRLRVRGGPADRDVVAPVQAHEGRVKQICAVRADEDGLSFVTGGDDWFLRKWRLADGALTLTAEVDVSEETTPTP